MKALFKLKIVLIIIIAGFLFSCKNNKDGYSDEIDTSKTPVDTASADTTNINNGPNTTGTSAPGKPNASGTSTTGTGTGPGPSAKDGSAYDISSQTKEDTTKLGAKALKKEKRSKE